MSELTRPNNRPESLNNWSDADVEWVFAAITKGDEVQIVSDAELANRVRDPKIRESTDPTFEEIFYHLIDKGYTLEEIKSIHQLDMRGDGSVVEASEDTTDKSAEVVYEI